MAVVRIVRGVALLAALTLVAAGCGGAANPLPQAGPINADRLLTQADADAIHQQWVATSTSSEVSGTDSWMRAIAGPERGSSQTGIGSHSCRTVGTAQGLWVSCDPLFATSFVGWSLAGAEQIKSAWVMYEPSTSVYKNFILALTIQNDFEAGLLPMVGVPFRQAHLVARRHGATVVVSGMFKASVSRQINIVLSSGSDPLPMSETVSAARVAVHVSMSGWGQEAKDQPETVPPKTAIPFTRVESELAGG